MAWLAQPVASFTYQLAESTAAALLRSKLQERGVTVDPERKPVRMPGAGTTIVARCITQCLNMWLWRCWSDRLEFQLHEVGAGHTRVTVNAIPNFLRTGLRSGEQATDVQALVAGLRSS
jgi:hypothetical protein